MTIAQTLRNLHGNKVAAAVQGLHRSENEMAGALRNIADRHEADHEVCHVARDISCWSAEHVRRLSEAGRGYGLTLDPDPRGEDKLLSRLTRKGSELTGRFHEPTLLLLADLRHIHQMAAGVSLDWEVLAQTAQALQDTDLLALAQDCHPQSLRQLRWANSKVKETAAQTMVTG